MSSIGLLTAVYNPCISRTTFNFNAGKPLRLSLSVNASASPENRNHLTSSSSGSDILRKLAVSSVFVIGLGIGHRPGYAFSTPIIPAIAPSSMEQDVIESLDTDDADAAEMKEVFEKWKAKTFALTVPLRIVALRNSLPPVWFKDFVSSQGKRLRFLPQYRQSFQEIYSELCMMLDTRNVKPNSVSTADIVSVGDSWLGFAVKEGLIEPIQGVEEQDWFRNLSDKWKGYVRRSDDGNMSSHGQIWAVPYRWGSVVIAYKKKKFQKYNLAPIEDWADLWRPELAGKISMVDSPREIIGAVLKYMGSLYNTHNFDSEVVGGKTALLENLALLVKQVRLFDSQYYLRAFAVDDVWVAVGWSSDILPAAKRMSNVGVIVPKSGSSLWADFWAIPCTSRVNKLDNIGGRVRGPSPLVNQWMEFCLQAQRATSFTEGAIPGASPVAFEDHGSDNRDDGQQSNRISCGPPPGEILDRCEFLEPLPEETLRDYEQMINSLKRGHDHSWMQILQVFKAFLPKVQSKV